MFSFAAARPQLRQSEAGQATIEAVLVGFISFLLVMGLVYQFHTGFRDYVDNYFGNYLVCLLETGELPGLGSESGGVCGEALAAFELGEEGPGLEASGAGTSDPGRSSGGSGGGNADGGSAQGGSGGNITYVDTRRGGAGVAGPGDDGSAGASAEEASASESGSSGGDFGGGSSPGYRIVEMRRPSGSGLDKITVKRSSSGLQLADPASGSGGRTLIAKENENALTAPKLTFHPDSLKRTPDSEEEEMPWNFSDYLRYLIILAIIIAIIILVGGQALQISKSRDL